jgi:hypothetical protein
MSEAGLPNPASEAPADARESAPPVQRSFVERLTGALRLDGSVFEEVAADSQALAQAAGVAALAGAARAIGAAIALTRAEAVLGALSVFGFWPLVSVTAWAVSSWFGHPTSFLRVLRAMGFAMAPLVLVVFIAVPNLWVQSIASLVSFALLLAAVVVALRHALRVETARAMFVGLVVALIMAFLYLVAVYLIYRPAPA